ncbi:mycofactocin-coupled SDR family oxidoreductase [Serratia fonticola]|uniref:Mycofactocin-coupled SDR family oxidoreductase n=1 Tax=Serratia fonticola TaxID=47917 RepID=A0AAJ1YGJ3_SERFO|nr:mycofactocin-coupled SDR family oxidoreductase [Serratia fonticola]MDQ9130221.1 mycofactocin-coupled SDR family oxidoreductase [Serratia fonticola]
MATQFANKTVFITGAAKGQGKAVAIAFAREGANIIAFDLGKKITYPQYNQASVDDLAKLQQEVEQAGGKILTFAGDVRNAQEVSAAVEQGVAHFGTIDILFNNAGICAYGLSHELTEEAWDTMLDINLKGAWLVSKYVIPHFIRQKSGVIITNSSIGGLRGMNRLSHYAASKFALIGLTKSQAIELAPYNVRAISIHPTGVNTAMNDGLAAMEGATPQEIAERSAGNLLPAPWIEPEDVADSVLFLASDKARFITGSQFVLDAGLLTK